jgi:hypothetical protein
LGKSVFEIEHWPASHIQEWKEYFALEPFGPWRDNYHVAMLGTLIANAMRGKDSPIFELDDFMYKTTDEIVERRKQKDLAAFNRIVGMVEAVKDGAE